MPPTGFRELVRERYSQAFRVVVVRTAGREQELRRIYDRDWFVQAPLVLAVCAVPDEAWVRAVDGWSAAGVDATIAMTHLLLAAADEGLGTCWVASFDPAAAVEVLCLPDGVVPWAFTPLGHPSDTRPPKERRPLEELVLDRR